MKAETEELDANWQKHYYDMIMSAKKALAHVRSGQRVFIGTGCGEPKALVEALVARAGTLADVEIVQLLTTGDAPFVAPGLSEVFRINSFFVAAAIREHIREGLGGYTPISMSDIPSLFYHAQLPLDIALIQVSLPDKMGRVSLGVSVDIVKAAAANASLVIGQVNAHMPRTLGDCFLNVYDFDILVPQDDPIMELPPLPADEITERLGERVAALIEDGATIELGLGRLPHRLVKFLRQKKELGVHSEMVSDWIMDLVDSGSLTGSCKTMDQGKITTSFCVGTRKLYDFVDNNPLFSFRPTEYVNDTTIISRQHKMTSVNTALQVDLTGQVCADSLGTEFFWGMGGMADFNRGTARCQDGVSIIALESTALNGRASRIVSRLSLGSGVVLSRADVEYVVTEYGTAYLRGKSVHERALALIAIAHPDFREELLKDAVRFKYLYREFAELEERFIVPSHETRSSMLLSNGILINFRPIHPTDEPRMRDLLYALSQETVYYRFMGRQFRFGHQQICDLVYVDHRKDVAIVGTVPEAHGEAIVAVGRYYLNEQTNRAEVAFVIHDEWQNRRIGSFLFHHLYTIAKRNGIAGFTAEVLRDNRRMQSIFKNSGFTVKSHLEEGVLSFQIDF